jgi:hypothetical protein
VRIVLEKEDDTGERREQAIGGQREDRKTSDDER